nr:acylphosphatase [Candidatus Sigynarchaeota archaeon]
MKLHAIIEGEVQGVGFRWHTQRRAESLHLTGWVKNLDDGRVEVVAEGNKTDLEQLLAWLDKGPSNAAVTGVESEFFDNEDGFDGFSIITD